MDGHASHTQKESSKTEVGNSQWGIELASIITADEEQSGESDRLLAETRPVLAHANSPSEDKGMPLRSDSPAISSNDDGG